MHLQITIPSETIEVTDVRIAPTTVAALLRKKGFESGSDGLWWANNFLLGGEVIEGDFTWVECLTLLMLRRDLDMHNIVRTDSSEVKDGV